MEVVNKKWYVSKTVWVNVVATIGIIAQAATGKIVISPEVQVAIISVINLALRAITKENITW